MANRGRIRIKRYEVLSDRDRDRDRMSSLPDDILCHILSLFPIKDAVQTSVLSSRWRHLFFSMTILNLDFKILPSPRLCEQVKKFVDRYLNQDQVGLECFSFHGRRMPHASIVGYASSQQHALALVYPAQNEIEPLPKEIPSCLLFHVKNITILRLSGRNSDMLEMIAYFLQHTTFLENLVLTINTTVFQQQEITRILLSLPRKSKECRILV
ncbi:hypothetical protein GQ457_11G032760 [Hibiscus cannabinus]